MRQSNPIQKKVKPPRFELALEPYPGRSPEIPRRLEPWASDIFSEQNITSDQKLEALHYKEQSNENGTRLFFFWPTRTDLLISPLPRRSNMLCIGDRDERGAGSVRRSSPVDHETGDDPGQSRPDDKPRLGVLK
jgi:hypothetical protein